MDYRGKSFMNPDKKMTGVPATVSVATPKALTKPIGAPSTSATSVANGNPMRTIVSRSNNHSGGL